jgi:hypothetical protein
MKTYGNIYKYFVWIAILCVSGCSPVYRFNRLVECHPYLLESVKSDTIHIREGKIVDTFFTFKSETDSFYINSGIRIERYRDTLRVYFRERNCTTYIEKTEIRPSKVVTETTIRKEIEREGNKGLIKLSLYVFLSLLIVGLLRTLFGKNG